MAAHYTTDRRTVLKTSVAAFSGIALAGCSGEESEDSASGSNDNSGSNSNSNGDSDSGSNSNSNDDKQEVKIVEHDTYEKEFESGVKGKVKNVSDSTLDYVEVEVKFYDKDGNRLGDNFTNVEELGAGKTWEFKLMFLDDGEFADYKLTATTDALS